MPLHFYSSNDVVPCMAKLFSVSDEFRRLCSNVDMYPHSIDVNYSHSCAALFCVLELHDDLNVDFYFYGHLSALCLFIFSFILLILTIVRSMF